MALVYLCEFDPHATAPSCFYGTLGLRLWYVLLVFRLVIN